MSDTHEYFQRHLAVWNLPRRLAEFYNEPFIAARMGTTRLNVTRQDIKQFFVEVLEKYHAKGFAQAQLIDMEERSLGANSKLATVRWAYNDKAGKTLWEWTFSYNLYKVGNGWTILTQTLHD